MSGLAAGASAVAFAPWLAWWGSHALLTVAGVAPARRQPGSPAVLDVVIPAHDEEASLPRLLDSLRAQSLPLGRVVVVADHCSDATAAVARDAGVEVVERNEGPPGKPPAIAEGVAFLERFEDRGVGVIILDADCTCAPRFAAALAERLGPDDEVVQAAYTVSDAGQAPVRSGLRRAFALRNVVRPAGADRLGLPVLLTGSGILLRWDALERLSFGNSKVGFTGNQPAGADLRMGLDLLDAGIHPRFAAHATVEAPAPDSDDDLATQHLRWEGGQAVNWRRAAALAGRLARRGDWRGIAGLLDWMTPPLAPTLGAYGALTLVLAGGVAVGVVPVLALVPPAAAAVSLGTYLAVGVARLEGPGAVVDLAVSAPRFLLWKARLYRGFSGRAAAGG